MAAGTADLPRRRAHHAHVERRAARRHVGAGGHGAGQQRRVRDRQVRRLLGSSVHRLAVDAAAADNGVLARRFGLGAGCRRLPGRRLARRRVSRHRPVFKRQDRQSDRRADSGRVRLRRVLSGRQPAAGGTGQPSHRGPAARRRRRLAVRVHHPRRAGFARSVFLRLGAGRLSGTQRPRRGSARLGRRWQCPAPRRPARAAGSDGGELPRGQSMALGSRLAALGRDRGQAVLHLGGHPRLSAAIARTALAARLLQRQDPSAAGAVDAASAELAHRIRSGWPRPGARGADRPGGRRGTRRRGQLEIRHPPGAVPSGR